ncbi:MAG TPA: aldehyde reductase [Candidatus Binatia bacterium]|jgi:nucleoside-diphosphate-sugar epimerase
MTEGDKGLVLVTGASGYIGGHVTREFLEHGYRVRGTVRSLANPKKVDHLRELGHACGGRLELVEADLDREDGWSLAVAGCTFVEHVASPFPAAAPKDEDELIRPAVQGTLRVLGAAAECPSVRRVVITSSVAAVAYGHSDHADRVLTEDDWSVAENCEAYQKSKTLAERSAWDFVSRLPESRHLELVVINPGFVAGPLSGPEIGTSGEVVRRLMKRELPACPEIGWAVVDVRDVAIAHRLATETPGAAGNRFIAAGDHMWMQDIGKLLAHEFNAQGYKPPTGHLPYPLLWLASRFDSSIRLVLQYVGKRERVSHEKAARMLGWQPRPVRETFVDMARSMIDKGLIPAPR